MFYILCTFSIAVYGLSAAEVPLPSITICKRNSVNYSDCLKAAIQEAWPQFVKGLPEFNFPSLEPLNYEFGNAVFDRGIIHAVVNVSNFIVTGISKTSFLAVKPHFTDEIFRLEIDIKLPKIIGSGECDAIGTLGAFKIDGKGHFNLTMEDLQGTLIIKGHVANDIWTVDDFHAAPSVKKLKVHLEDFFSGSKEFNDLVMMFANEYWPSIYRAMLPTAAKAWNPWLCNLVNRFFSRVSFTKLFP